MEREKNELSSIDRKDFNYVTYAFTMRVKFTCV